MQRDDVVGLRYLVVKTVTHHGYSTINGFFRGLAEQDERAAPLVFHGDQLARCTYQRSDVDIVPAGMHHPGFLSARQSHLDGTGVGQTGLFLDGQGVHVCTNQDRRAIAIFHDAHQPIAFVAG